MKHITTDVLVIGGGATGTGVLRDLAMRGFSCILVEKRDLAHGTTGRYHGLLHSGGRYVVKDPQAAQECIAENRILRRIMPFCIEDTGGFFVTTPWDDPGYADRFVQGCHNAGIPVEEVSPAQMLKEEPLLNPAISRCLRVPDAAADSFLAAEANALSAQQHGATSLTYHEVKRLVAAGGRVRGAICYDLVHDEEVQIEAGMVVNASGAWAGKIVASVGLEVQIKPGKGTMVAINQRVLNTVVNRCKVPADGDIIVPIHTVAVIGTTDEQVSDADHISIEPWEIQLMLEEGEKLIPTIRGMRMLRAWAGVRPLYQEAGAEEGGESRDITRAYILLDHEARDGVGGLVTITSGKWTTYRLMAEATVDLVTRKLGSTRTCQTHLEVLPSPEAEGPKGHFWLGTRLASLEQEKKYGSLICECELVTEAEVQHAITVLGAKSIDDIRRDTRLGMGPCQGGFCTFRVTGMLHELRSLPVEQANGALRDFLQERWKGLLPVLWGQQLRQERLDELIYLDVLNVPGLPGPEKTRLAPENYAPPAVVKYPAVRSRSSAPAAEKPAQRITARLDALVIGAGLAGLFTTLRLAINNQKVRCISKGWGAQYWASGCIDVLSARPGKATLQVPMLRSEIDHLVAQKPGHPYAVGGIEPLEQALAAIRDLCEQAGYPLHAVQKEDILGQNWLLPTALGTLRQTCLAPETMLAGGNTTSMPGRQLVLVGFDGYPDFYPQMAAANLKAQGIQAQPLRLNIPALTQRRFVTSRVLAQLLEQLEFRQLVARSVRSQLGDLDQAGQDICFGFPAVLGLQPSLEVWRELQGLLGFPVFEMPGLPPSIPGMRLHQVLVDAIRRNGGQVYEGMQAIGAELDGTRIAAVTSEAAARTKRHYARQVVLATGGILGGGLTYSTPGPDQPSYLFETILDAPIHFTEDGLAHGQSELLRDQFLHPQGHEVFRAGIQVDDHFRVLNPDGTRYLENLAAVGGILAGADPVREGSLEGIALLSAFIAAESILETNLHDHDPEFHDTDS